MALMLTRDGVMSRVHGYRAGARGLLRGADTALRREIKVVRTSEIALSSFSFGLLQGRFKDKGGLTLFGLPVDLLAGTAFHILGLLFSPKIGLTSPSPAATPTTCTPSETAPSRRSSRRRATGWASGGPRGVG